MSTSESTPKKKRTLLAVRESTRQSLRWRFKEWAVEPPVSCPGYLYCKKCRLCVQANRDTMRKHEKSKGHKNSMRRNTLEESFERGTVRIPYIKEECLALELCSHSFPLSMTFFWG